MTTAADFWRTERDWFARNRQRVDRSELWAWLLRDVPREAAVLEVGAGDGGHLDLLQRLGFTNLTGMDINSEALGRGTEAGHRDAICGDICSIPIHDGAYDLALTSGTLIHVPPSALPRAVGELCRVSRRWVAGFEYWAARPTEIVWRGRHGVMWKADYPAQFEWNGLTLAETAYSTHINGDIDCAYLAVKA